MKPIFKNFTYSIYKQRERKKAFLSQSDKNSGSYDNLELLLTYNIWEKWKLAFIAMSLQICWQKFYRNVPWVAI